MTTGAEAQGRLSIAEYYAQPRVRARIVEYCGGADGTPPTAAYVAALSRKGGTGPFWPSWEDVPRVPASQIDTLWAASADLARSLWDTEQLIFMIELDYQNTDAPAEPFRHPADVFCKLEPAYQAALSVFQQLQLDVPAVATGRGYHFTGAIPLADPLVDRLAAMVPHTPDWYAGIDARRPKGVTAAMSERQARAATGLGCLIEFAAHLILDRAADSAIPVMFNGTPVGLRSAVGRESVSIDFSHVGDPLDVRHVRVPFSTYQWHRLRPDIFGQQTATMIPPIAVVPRGRHSLLTPLMQGRDLGAASRAAARARPVLPNVARGVEHLLARYRASSLGRLHERLDADMRADGAAHPPLERALPPCMTAALTRPNDLLLKPEHLQHLVRGLMSHGWRPAAIARRVQSAYAADHSWGDRWTTHMDTTTRATFETRVFSGMIGAGRDPLVDFNCVSAQEKGLCPRVPCTHDLRRDRERLAAPLT